MAATPSEPDPDEALQHLDDKDIESEEESEDLVEDEEYDSEGLDDHHYLDPIEDCDEHFEESIRKLEIEEQSKVPKPPPAKRTRSIADVVGSLPLQKSPATEISSHTVKSDQSIILGRDGTKWSTESKDGPQVSDVRPGPLGDAKLRTEPIGCFRLFFSESINKKILAYTNEKISAISKKYAKPEESIQATNFQELEALFGVLFLSAALRSNHLSSELLFQKEYCGSRFVATMSRWRFEFLTKTLRFDEVETRSERKAMSKLALINEVWDLFVDNCMKNYVPSSYVTIDQQMLSFKGKCPFRVRKKTVPRACGLKILMMCDNANKYMFNAIPHLGKDSLPPGVPESEYYVKELVEPIKGSHRNITIGKQFTSVPLVRDLLNDYGLTVVGVVRNNTEELPACFVDTNHQNRSVDSSFFIFSEEVSAVSYKPSPRKLLCFLSSSHHEAGAGRRPQAVITYSKTKGAVGAMDEMCSSMSTSRKTRRWSMCLFYNMLNIAAVNSYVIYLHNFFRSEWTRNQKPLSRMNFMLKLSEQLTSTWQKHRLEKIPSLSKELKLLLRQLLGIVKLPASMNCGGEQHGKRTYCANCHYSKHRMTSVYCSTCGRPICGEHQKRVCVDC